MKTAKDLMGKLEITKQEALELLEVEEAYQEWYRGGECTFKKWNDRIYITFSERSATANKKKSYYDLEAGLLHDTYVRFEADRTEEVKEIIKKQEGEKMKERVLIGKIRLLDGDIGSIYTLGDAPNIEIFGVCDNEDKTLSEGHNTYTSCIDFIKMKYKDQKWNLIIFGDRI